MLAIWAGLEVFTKGTAGAFGGLFASGAEPRIESSTPERAAKAFQRAYDKSTSRVDKALDE